MPPTLSSDPPTGGPPAHSGSAGGAAHGPSGADQPTPARAQAGPSRANAGDPLFQRAEPSAPTSKKAALLWQYFFFPLLIVGAALGLFLGVSVIAREETNPEGLLTVLIEGGENRQRQAAQQLAIQIAQERNRIDSLRRDGKPIERAPFYAEPSFRARLLEAFRLARREESEERVMGLARALGRAEVVDAIPVFLEVLYPPPDGKSASTDVRRAVAIGLLHFESRAAESAFLRISAESEHDAEVRNAGFNGLALLGLPIHGGVASEAPGVMERLRSGLDATHDGIRLNAAYGLAMRGDDAGAHLIERSLSRQGLASLGVDPQFHTNALTNAMAAALALRHPSFRPLIERLTDTANEGDDVVRDSARQALARWNQTPVPATDSETIDGR